MEGASPSGDDATKVPLKNSGGGGGLSEIWRREIGSLNPKAFLRRVGGSEAFVKRINCYRGLEYHRRRVNTVSFNTAGNLLVSGSNDRDIVIWDWAARSKRLAYTSGHSGHVLQAKIMPFTDNRTIISSDSDGQVRLSQITESGHVETKSLGNHSGSVSKLAIQPESSYIFYSCGEDGFVQHFDLRSQSPTRLFMCSSFAKPKYTIRLKSVVVDPCNPNYFSLGGFEEYARVYDIRSLQHRASSVSDHPVNTFCPHHLMNSETVHITGLAYSRTSELLVSYNDELVYLFQKDMGLGPNPGSASTDTLQMVDQAQVYLGHRNYLRYFSDRSVGFVGPGDDYVTSGSDCGHVFIWKKKGGELMRMFRGGKWSVTCIDPHPYFPCFATGGTGSAVKVWFPIWKRVAPVPSDAQWVMEENKKGREDDHSSSILMDGLRAERRIDSAKLQSDHVETKSLGTHRGSVHKLAIQPGSSYIFYSCGEDGFDNTVSILKHK